MKTAVACLFLWCLLPTSAELYGLRTARRTARHKSQVADSTSDLFEELPVKEQSRHENDKPKDEVGRSARQLLQTIEPSQPQSCSLSDEARERFYNRQTGSWRLDAAILEEIEGDFQRLVDCVDSSESIILSRGMEIKPVATVTIQRPISIVGEDARQRNNMPVWTCGSSQRRNQIAIISGVDGVVLSGINFVDCNSMPDSSPIVLDRSNISISNCRFENNRGSNGGVIQAHGSSLALTESVFKLNRANTSGGCIDAHDGSTIDARDCVFEENRSGDSGGVMHLANQTSASISRSSFIKNRAYNGAAFYASGSTEEAELRVDACTFEDNQAEAGGGALTLMMNRTIISGSTFKSNNGGAGGALFISSISGTSSSPDRAEIEITECDFERNNADTGGGMTISGGIFGSISQCNLRDNSAPVGGGGMTIFDSAQISCTNVDFINNRGGTAGGAVYLFSGQSVRGADARESGLGVDVAMKGGVCEGNSAQSGGCIELLHEVNLQISDFDITHNKASESGGGIDAHRINTLSLNNVNFDRNRANTDGGGVFIKSDSVGDSEVSNAAISHGTVTIDNCRFKKNKGRRGGGLYAFGHVSATISDSVFISNSVKENGGAMWLKASEYVDKDTFSSVVTANERRVDIEEVLEAARVSLQSFSADSEDLVPVLSMVINNSVFASNKAEDSGGAASVVAGCMLWAEHSVFENNKADKCGGSAYLLQSLFFCQHCTFSGNNAGYSGGALMIHGVTNGTTHGSPACEASVRHASFINNACGNHGGAVLVDGLEASFHSIENVTYRGNTARAGGGIATGNAAFVNLTSSNFIQNTFLLILHQKDLIFDSRAMDGGGGLSLSFLQFRRTRCAISNVRFTENTAIAGGAIYAEFYVYVDKQMDQTHAADDTLTDPSIQMNNTVFLENSAHTGGAVELYGVPGRFRNITMARNKATKQGGAMCLIGLSIVQIIGGNFRRNEALSGGALHLGERSAVHCINCNVNHNTASDSGGGIDIHCMFVKMQPVVFQCDGCTIKQNSARIGGGMLMYRMANPYGTDPSDEVIVILRDVELVDNDAQVGGGGIMATHPQYIAVQCSSGTQVETLSNNITEGFAQINKMNDFPRLLNHVCRSWTGNRVGKGGYGDLRATFGAKAVTCISKDNECQQTNGVLPMHSSAAFIPPIKITLVDQFGQFPAEPGPDHQDLMASPESDQVRMSGQLHSIFNRGEALLTETTVIGHPGKYRMVLRFHDDRIEDVELNSELQSCSVGQQSVLNDTACQWCEIGTFSVREPLDICEECPDNCVCRRWGIQPTRGHWLPSPCTTKALECLSEHACAYGTQHSYDGAEQSCVLDGREEAMDDFFEEEDPTCDLSDTAMERFRAAQCNEGHTGLLCGSCSADYGQVGLECNKCMPKALVAFLLILNLGWFLLVSAIAIKGNLMRCMQSEKRPRGFIHEDKGGPSEQPQTMVDMYISGDIPTPLPPGTGNSKKLLKQTLEMDPYESAKRNVAERFKLFVNFAQVNGLALIMNTEWTQAAVQILRALDFTGEISGEAAITLDCLFSESSSVPRSVSKTILSLFMPFILLAILSLLRAAKHKHTMQILKRRLILTVLIVLYISYIGLARRVFSVLHCVRIQDGKTPEDSTNNLYWSQDTSVACYEGSHAYLLGLLAVPMIIVVLLAFPIGSALFLFKARSDHSLETCELKETFGFMYQAYKEEYVFWDCTILLRKAALAMVVIFGSSLAGNIQGLIAVCILGIALFFHISCLPFNDDFFLLNSNERFSLVVSFMTFLSGVFLNDSSVNSGGRVFFSVFVLLANLSFVFYSVFDIYLKCLRVFRTKLERDNVAIKAEEVHVKLVVMYLKHQWLELSSKCKKKRNAV